MFGAFNTDPLCKRYNEIDPTFLNVDNVPEVAYELDEISQRFQR
jgi:hypothetical protein